MSASTPGTGITLVAHASVLVDAGPVCVWTDPWLSGTAFNDSWDLLAPAVLPEGALDRVTHLWISHEHADHFHVATLRALPDELKGRVRVLLRAGDAAKLATALGRLGFADVCSIPHRGRVPLGDGVTAYSYEVGQMDTCLAVEHAGRVVVDVNDAELSDPDRRLLRADLGRCDVLLDQFSLAGYGGHPDRADRLAAQASRVLDTVVRDHEGLDAAVTVPIASYVYFCTEDNRYVNEHANRPSDVARVLADRGHTSVVLVPGERYEVGAEHDSSQALAWWDERYDALDDLPYRRVAPVPLADVEAGFDWRCDQLRTVLPELVVRRLGPVVAHLPDRDETIRFDVGRRTFERLEGRPPPDLTVDSQPLAFALGQPFGVQTLGVSARATVAPGNRSWRRHRIACAVAHSGLDLRLHRLACAGNRRLVRPRLRGGLTQVREQLRRNA